MEVVAFQGVHLRLSIEDIITAVGCSIDRFSLIQAKKLHRNIRDVFKTPFTDGAPLSLINLIPDLLLCELVQCTGPIKELKLSVNRVSRTRIRLGICTAMSHRLIQCKGHPDGQPHIYLVVTHLGPNYINFDSHKTPE